MNQGVLFILSLVYLSLVVCSVYTLAVEKDGSVQRLARSIFWRLLRLLGLLGGLAIVTQIFTVL